MTAPRSYPDRDALIAAWLAASNAWLGTPYRHQAARRGVGADCVGLIAGIWAEIYGTAPSYARDYAKGWAEVGRDERLLNACRQYCQLQDVRKAPEAGDLIVFRPVANALAKHIALCSGPAKMRHAVERRCVCETAITPWWRRCLVGIFKPPLAFKA